MTQAPTDFAQSLALYRLLIRLQPGRLREMFGDEMVADFAQLLGHECSTRTVLGRVRAWRRALVDLLFATPSANRSP